MDTARPYFFLIPPKVPDGEEKGMTDIQDFIKEKQWEFSSQDLKEEVLKFIPMQVALKAWLEKIEHPETKRKYKWAMEKFLLDESSPTKIEPSASILCLDKSVCKGITYRLSHLDASASAQEFIMTAYNRFCNFIRTLTYGIIDPEEGQRKLEGFYRAEAIYSTVDWSTFLNALEAPYQLIAKLIFLAAERCQYRVRVGDRYKNVLSLTIDQINFKEGTISFREEQSYHVVGLTVAFPQGFMDDLKAYIGSRTNGIVFTSRSGSSKLFPKQLERAFDRASTKLKLQASITPVVLAWAGVIAHKKAFQEQLKT